MQQTLNETNIRQYLAENYWPNGLQDALLLSINKFPLRFFILDDSGKRNYLLTVIFSFFI